MSYILEALRKAEQERSLGRIPDLETIYAQLPSPRRRRIWLWLLLALALIGNTMVLVMMVPQRDSHQTGLLSSPAAITPRPVPSAAQTPPELTPPSPQAALAQTRPEQPTADSRFPMPRLTPPLHPSESLSEANTTGTVAAAPPTAVSSPPQLQKPEPPPPAKGTDAPKVGTTSSRVPPPAPTELLELPEALQRAIPALNLDIHVYHEMPGRSFVVINSRRYQAGDTLSEGPFLDRITANGVILNQQGHRFLLPVHR